MPFFLFLPSFMSEGRGCLEEGCLGLPGVSQTFLELRFSVGNEGKDRKNLNSQTWPGTPSPRHPRPPDYNDSAPGLGAFFVLNFPLNLQNWAKTLVFNVHTAKTNRHVRYISVPEVAFILRLF